MIKWGSDLGAPAAVAVLDIVTTEKAPEANKPVMIGAAVVGYGCAWARVGGDFVKNIGIAAMPAALEAIYYWVKAKVAPPAAAAQFGARRLAMRPTRQITTSTVVSPAGSRSEEAVAIIQP